MYLNIKIIRFYIYIYMVGRSKKRRSVKKKRTRSNRKRISGGDGATAVSSTPFSDVPKVYPLSVEGEKARQQELLKIKEEREAEEAKPAKQANPAKQA